MAEAMRAILEEQKRWFQQQLQDLNNANIVAHQQLMLKQHNDNQKKKEKGPSFGSKSMKPTQLEATAKSKKIRSYALISSDEIFGKWEKGLCELCDELYFPGHKCKKMGSILDCFGG